MDLSTNYRDWAIMMAMILAIIGFGYLALNGFMDYRFKAQLLSTPCDLCLELNEHIDLCPKQIKINDNNYVPNSPISFPALNG